MQSSAVVSATEAPTTNANSSRFVVGGRAWPGLLRGKQPPQVLSYAAATTLPCTTVSWKASAEA